MATATKRTKNRSSGSASRGSSAKSSGRTSSQRPNKNGRTGTSKTTTSHEQIRRWAESRDGEPSVVKATRARGRSGGLLRFNFPGYRGEDTLQEISWREFFRTFDENDLAFLYQEKTATGRPSRFHKFVDRETARGNKP